MSRSRWAATRRLACVPANGSGKSGPERSDAGGRLGRGHPLVPPPSITRMLCAVAASAVVLALVPTTALASVRHGSSATRGSLVSSVTLALGSGYGQPGGSAQVRSLQRRLERAGFAPGPIDGLYGPLTQGAVERFQTAHGLSADGIAGRETWSALTTPTPTLYPGSGYAARGSSRVRALQRRLRGAGYGPGPVDGRYGPETERAVVRFQTARGLPVDGIAGPETLAGLRKQVAATPRPRRRSSHPSHLVPVPAPPPLAAPIRPAVIPSGSSALIWILPLAALAMALAGAMYVRRRTRTRRVYELPSTEGGLLTSQGGTPVLGYASARTAAERTSEWLGEQAEAIAQACDERGLELLQVVGEHEPHGRVAPVDRPGLGSALERISQGEARGLVVAELSRLASSAAELGTILDRLADSDARLVAAADRFDTGEDDARLAAGLLIDVSNRERDRIGDREEFDAHGRPIAAGGVPDEARLERWIMPVRDREMSPEAIAERLTESRRSGRAEGGRRRAGERGPLDAQPRQHGGEDDELPR
jgi:peptidoglycan hydrolase-like protein with peptidoglycan-binding domain